MATPDAATTPAHDGQAGAHRPARSTKVFDWSALGIGAAMVWVAFLLPADPLGQINLVISGVAVIGFALAARAARGERWHWQLLAANVGLWLVAMPALWYDRPRPYHFATAAAGALVILLMVPPLWSASRQAAASSAALADARRHR
jgi:hypothetical protein